MTQAGKQIVAYKGFDADWKCRGFQYEVGKTYTHDGGVKLCPSPKDVAAGFGGFHACEYPLDVFNYYPPTGQIAIVELGGIVPADPNGDSKRAGKSITIKALLTIPALISAAIEYTTSRCNPVKAKHSTGDRSASSATGYSSASSATGDNSASSATGYSSASSATGDRSASSATGDNSASSATGDNSASSATGDNSASSATGDSSASSATGDRSASSATGYRSASSATGYSSASSATGDNSASSATGDRSASSATGDNSASSATGYNSASSATGDRSASITTGAYSSSAVTKEDSHSVAAAVGYQSKARGAKGCAIVCVYRNDDGHLIHIRASKVGENGIKPDVFYTLNDAGDFVEAV